MKIKRIVAIPFALAADIVTLGKMGDGSFTQDIFNAEDREQRFNQDKEAAELLVKLIVRLARKG